MFDFAKFFANARTACEAKAVPAALKAATQFGAVVIGQAENLCPVLTGFLKASGTWEPATQTADTITCVIGFNCKYAAAVHERLELHHPQGQAKFLEAAMQAQTANFGPYVANAIKDALG
jgi:hypothetical protein